MANPTMTVSDLPGLAAIAREAGLVFGVDATFASPAVCRPLEHGVDVVVHSATKYLGGHSDSTGGVAVGRPELMAKVKHDRVELGGIARARRGLPAAPRPRDPAAAGRPGLPHGDRRGRGRAGAPGGASGSSTRACRPTRRTSWP